MPNQTLGEPLDFIESNAQLVLKHVTDLLDAAKLESAAMAASYSQGDLKAWLRQWINLFSGAAEQRHVSLKVEGDDVEMEVDVEHLRRVITNLLGNAMKFTPMAGTIVLGHRREGDRVIVTVDDSGPGIAPENREIVFERFRQLDGGATRQVGGTGLGLAICRQLVTLLQGTISIDTSPLGGARVVVALPVSAPSGTVVGTAIARETVLMSPAALDAVTVFEIFDDEATVERHEHPVEGTVLVCEDNPQLRAFLVEVLGERYNVIAVANGALGLERIKQNPPDLIITDIMMPIMSGDQLIAELQRDADLSSRLVLVLSALDEESLREYLLEHGAKDYLNKPFRRKELLARVENLMTLQKHTESLEEQVKERTAQLSQNQERLAQELNDTVIRGIFGASLALQGAVQRTTEPKLREIIRSAVDEMDLAIRQVRSAVFDLETGKG